MGLKLIDKSLAAIQSGKTFGFADHFVDFVDGGRWTDTSGDTGAAVAKIDGAGGLVTLTTGATDNNECYLHTTSELFKVAQDKPCEFEAWLSHTEANTDDANVACGFMDAVGANAILDNGGGPKSSYSGAVFFKVDGGTNWNIEVSNGGTQTTVELTAANSLDGVAHTAGGGSQQKFRIEIVPYNSTKAEVRFFIDGVLVYKVTEWTYTSVTEMDAFIGVKAGDTNSEVVTVDFASFFAVA